MVWNDEFGWSSLSFHNGPSRCTQGQAARRQEDLQFHSSFPCNTSQPLLNGHFKYDLSFNTSQLFLQTHTSQPSLFLSQVFVRKPSPIMATAWGWNQQALRRPGGRTCCEDCGRGVAGVIRCQMQVKWGIGTKNFRCWTDKRSGNCWVKFKSWIPSGKRLHNYGKSLFISWIYPLFQWPFTLAYSKAGFVGSTLNVTVTAQILGSDPYLHGIMRSLYLWQDEQVPFTSLKMFQQIVNCGGWKNPFIHRNVHIQRLATSHWVICAMVKTLLIIGYFSRKVDSHPPLFRVHSSWQRYHVLIMAHMLILNVSRIPKNIYSWLALVGDLEHVLFVHILGIIIPTDFQFSYFFQRGRYTTNQIGYPKKIIVHIGNMRNLVRIRCWGVHPF